MDTQCSRIVFAFALGLVLGGCAGGGAPSVPVAAAASSAKEEAAPPPSALNWLDYGMNAGLTGYNSKEKTLGTGNVADLQSLWSSTSSNIRGVSGLVEDASTFFVESTVSSAAYLTAINGSTGSQVWTADLYNFGYNQGIAAGDGLVFAPCEVGGSVQEQGLCAFSQATGTLKWSYTNSCNCDPPSIMGTPPVFAGNTVYFEYAYGGTGQNGYFLALDAKTGATIWTYGCASNCGLVGAISTPAVGKGKVYFQCDDYHTSFNGICAFNASNGDLLWQYSGTSGGNAAVSVAGSTAYIVQSVSGEIALTALDASSGTAKWTTTVCNGSPSQNCSVNILPPAETNKQVFAVGANYEIAALDAKNGKMQWTSRPSCNGYSSTATIANGVVYLLGGPNCPANVALNAATGAQLWQSSGTGNGGPLAPPIVLNGTVYANCWDLCAYGLSNDPRKKR